MARRKSTTGIGTGIIEVILVGGCISALIEMLIFPLIVTAIFMIILNIIFGDT